MAILGVGVWRGAVHDFWPWKAPGDKYARNLNTVPSAQDTGTIGGKRKKGGVLSWVIWESRAGKGPVPQERPQ